MPNCFRWHESSGGVLGQDVNPGAYVQACCKKGFPVWVKGLDRAPGQKPTAKGLGFRV